MRANLVTVAADGSISGLQVKPGKGFDFKMLGRASIKRASEIVWDEPAQGWRIDVLQGRFASYTITDTLWAEHGPSTLPKGLAGYSNEGAWVFDSYEAAVDAEIMFLDHVRLTLGPGAL